LLNRSSIGFRSGLFAGRWSRVALNLWGDVLCPFGADRLRPEAEPGLRQVATLIRSLRPRSIAMAGHTASVGAEAAPRDLSLRRARAVQRRLEDRAGAAMPPVMGEARDGLEPAQPNALPDGRGNPEGRAANRRVDFVPER
jgi:outer membrane protein OmpA-like peptidoglycan-associated protein